MKRILVCFAFLSMSLCLFAQSGYDTYEASEFTLIGKVMQDNPNPYHRVDTVKYKGFTASENFQVRCPSGTAVLFETNSPFVAVATQFSHEYESTATMPLSYRGCDVYVYENGEWIWAGATAPARTSAQGAPKPVVANMAPTMKKFMMYLPIYSDVKSIRICVKPGSEIHSWDSPFRHKVVFHGSSYTHGISTSRAGMAYPSQFSRHTGIEALNLGVSGNCKMQPYFADVIADVEADAYVFDSFSNPNAEMIEKRLFPFIEKIQAAHPGKPLIFQQTIRRENRNYNLASDKNEAAKQHMADSLMRIAVKKYKDVYFIQPNASVPSHESMVDGVHPDDYGYYLWSKSIEKPILRILKKYGVR